MTDDIDNLPAGRDADALVAERVMGWTRRWADRHYEIGVDDIWYNVGIYDTEAECDGGRPVPIWCGPRAQGRDAAEWEPSSDPSAMMEVVAALHAREWWVGMVYKSGLFDDDYSRMGWEVTVRARQPEYVWGVAESLPLALARAALKCVRKAVTP